MLSSSFRCACFSARLWAQAAHRARLVSFRSASSQPALLELLPRPKGLLLDAAGTLIYPSEPAAKVYLRFASRYGCKLSEAEVLSNFRRAFNTPWTKSLTRYVGDGREFWDFIISETTGVSNDQLNHELYAYYRHPGAWTVTDGAPDALRLIRQSGMKLAVVSNFDTRLRPLLDGLELSHLFDTIVVSAEVGAEKPNPILFETACRQLGLQPEEVLHVGDDRRNDVSGARDAGCYAWLWGVDVKSFAALAAKLILPERTSLYE